MKRICERICLVLCLLCGPAAAQDVPFAEPPYPSENHREPMLLALGDLMGLAQSRHIKLWQAGKANYFQLVTYEAAKLSDSLYRAAMLYTNLPVPLIKAADEALVRITAAADKRNAADFQTAFRDLTNACNACHRAAGLDFVKIKTPTSSPFTNQDFTPPR